MRNARSQAAVVGTTRARRASWAIRTSRSKPEIRNQKSESNPKLQFRNAARSEALAWDAPAVGRPARWATCAVGVALLLFTSSGCQPGPSPANPASEGSVDAAGGALRAGQFDAAIADADDYLRGQPRGPQAAEAWYDKGEAFQRKVVTDSAERQRDLFEAHSAYLSALNARPPAALVGYIRAGLSAVALFQDDFPTCIEQAAAATPLVEDPQTKAALLFNTGVAQQRLSRFTDADQTFREVVQRYPNTPVAAAAQQRIGQHLFYVQLAEYASPAEADQATATLRSAGSVVSRRSNAAGRTVLDLGPFSTYSAARQQRDALGDAFPGAAILP